MSEHRARRVTLVVPGLFGPTTPGGGHDAQASRVLTEGLSLPALERFFSRAARTPVPAHQIGLEATLFDCFGVAREGADWPVAAVTRVLDGGGADSAWVLRADPVHLSAGLRDLVLTDSADGRLGADEAEALAAEINAELDRPDLRLEPLAPERWYLTLAEAPRLQTRCPWEVVGAAIGEHLPAGEDAGRFRALINDIQMILHASPVNRARERRGEPAINSVWLWGGGRVPHLPASDWQAVWGGGALVGGLARLAQTASHPLPGDARDWLGAGPAQGAHLLELAAGYRAARGGDVDGWRRFIVALEKAWMAPLLEALASRGLDSIEVRTEHALGFRLERRRLRHWWRRATPFARVMASAG